MARKKSAPGPATRPPAPAAAEGIAPAGYALALEQLKARIRSAQLKAAVSVNRELVQLYWDIGKQIVARQQAESWGRSVVDRLGRDLQREFPGVAGFSAQNLWKMRAFFLAYTEEDKILSLPVREFDGQSLPEPMRNLPWGHNTEVVFKVKDPLHRLWYARQTIEQCWSRAVLLHQIGTGAHDRQGKAITNFDRTLPEPRSDLAREVLKDPYHFDFLALGPEVKEEDIRRGLLGHLRDLGAAGVVAVAGFLFARALRRPPRPLTPEETTPRKLDALNAAPEFAFQVAAVTREYLTARLALPRERTTDEFVRVVEETKQLDEGRSSGLLELLERCDVLTFARLPVSEAERRELLDAARGLVASPPDPWRGRPQPSGPSPPFGPATPDARYQQSRRKGTAVPTG